MKKQSGFTLIELMVVMAIIAILAIAGLAAYVGYIKQARDTARISDLSTINKAILATVTNTGKSPEDIDDVVAAIEAVNNGMLLEDPLGVEPLCQPVATGDPLVDCGYMYAQCDSGSGFIVSTRFESASNQKKYTLDGLDNVDNISANGTLDSNVDDYWSLGSCTTKCASNDACDNGVATKGIANHTLIAPTTP